MVMNSLKLSLWNSYIQFDKNYTLIYNSNYDKFLLLKDFLVVNRIKNDRLDLIPPEVIKDLISCGMLVGKNVDEPSLLENTIKTVDENQSVFNLIINPTLNCNFKCWYCYEEHKAQSRMTDSSIIAVKKLIDRIASNSKLEILNLSFFGGEPLLQFDRVVVPIIEYASEICSNNSVRLNVQFTTNGALINNKILSFLREFNTSFQITLDGGKYFHDKTRFFNSGKPSYDIIVDNIFEIAKFNMNVVVRINYTLQNYQSITEIFERFRLIDPSTRVNLSIDLQPVWQENENLSSNHEHKEFLSNIKKKFEIAGFPVSHKAVFNYVVNSCYADKRNEVLINYNLDVFSCTARDFITEQRMGKLLPDGRVRWENNSLETKMNCKFKKSICRRCRIAPICGSGCRTKNLENPHENCNLNLSDDQIDDLILERFELYYINPNTELQ